MQIWQCKNTFSPGVVAVIELDGHLCLCDQPSGRFALTVHTKYTDLASWGERDSNFVHGQELFIFCSNYRKQKEKNTLDGGTLVIKIIDNLEVNTEDESCEWMEKITEKWDNLNCSFLLF